MGKFKASPPSAEPNDAREMEAFQSFVAGAQTRSTQLIELKSPHKFRDKPTCGINLRLTEGELDMIRAIAAHEDRSIQKIIKRLLIPAVEAELQRIRTP